MSTSASLPLNLLIDKEQNRVVFAESDRQFVDILLSFLTLPMGTIVRLLQKRSSLGCLDRLYDSVEKLDEHYLQSPACKTMLLRPRSAAGAHCEALAINIDDSDARVYYRCPSPNRSGSNPCGVSSVPDARCRCGGRCQVPILSKGAEGSDEDGVFVKGATSFMISDDLEVMPVSMGGSLALMKRMGIRDGNLLEKKTVHLGKEEILKLLKRSLVSRTPLTDVFLHEIQVDMIDVEEKSVMTDITQARIKYRADGNSKRINLKLYLSKESDKVVYAEAGEDLVDLLFSFLTVPLGSIIKLLDKHSSLGCIDNLYASVELLSSGFDYLKSKECKDLLLDPKLAPYFDCSNQLLKIEAMSSRYIKTCACQSCHSPYDRSFHGVFLGTYEEMNPKWQNSDLDSGGGYVKGMVKFLITDKLEVMPLSPISGVNIINKLMVPIGSLKEADASLGEAEALNLLRACLFSNMVLSDIFSPYLLTLLQQNWCGRFPRKSVVYQLN